MYPKKEHKIGQIISQGISDVFYIWRREFRKIFRDQGVLIFFVFVPLGYPILYSLIYTQEVVREVPVVAVDECHTQLSRDFLRKVDASPDVQIVAYSNDLEDARQAMREHKSYGIIRIPSNFSKNIYDVARTKQAHVAIYCDMGSLFYYKAILSSCTEVSLEMNKHIKARRFGSSTRREAQISSAPLRYENVALYNPQNGYASFLIPAVLMLIIQQTLALGIGMSAGTAVENNRFKDLVPINKHYNGTFRIVFGKALSYLMLYMVMAVWVLLIVPYIFQLNRLADPWTLLMFLFPYLTSCIFFAMTASVLVRSREKVMILFAFLSVPMLFISGISWPSNGIPAFWKVISFLFPSTFGINGFVRINNMAANIQDVQLEYHALWLQTGIYFISTCYVYRLQILLSRKHVIRKWKELKAERAAKGI